MRQYRSMGRPYLRACSLWPRYSRGYDHGYSDAQYYSNGKETPLIFCLRIGVIDGCSRGREKGVLSVNELCYLRDRLRVSHMSLSFSLHDLILTVPDFLQTWSSTWRFPGGEIWLEHGI